MILNLVEYLKGVSTALDYIEIDLFGVPTNHSKRVAYVSFAIGLKLSLSEEEVFDLMSLAILHDNGATISLLQGHLNKQAKEIRTYLEAAKSHCTIGERNIQGFPFFTQPKNVILYHHENTDGTGFFGQSKEQIPLMSQIIHLADLIDLNFETNIAFGNQELITAILTFSKEHDGTFFSHPVVEAFLKVSSEDQFWMGLQDCFIDQEITKAIGNYETDYEYEQIRQITKTFSHIIDAKSEYTQTHSSSVSENIKKMTDFYNMNLDEAHQLIMAADLHDLGKLGISNDILHKPSKLTESEFFEIKKHPTIAFECLKGIKGFENISRWIYNHHEKLDGSGYPRGIRAEELDFNSRLLACVDIFTALQENRPYRPSMNSTQAFAILFDMAKDHKIDKNICEDLLKAFDWK